MSEGMKAVLAWVYKAPLPAVIGMMLALGGWVVYAQDTLHTKQVEQGADIRTLKEKDAELLLTVKEMDGKLDKLLEAVLQSRAEQNAVQNRLDRAQARRDEQQKDRDRQAKEGQKP